MARVSDDYDGFRRFEPSARRQWVERRFPGGASAQWWLAMAELVQSEMTAADVLPVAGYREIADFGISLLNLAVDLGGVRPGDAVAQLAQFARVAISRGVNADDLPEGATPDGVIRRALDAIRMKPDAALAAARRRRAEIINDPNAICLPGQDVSSSNLPHDEGIQQLGEIEGMLGSLVRIVDHVHDAQLAEDIRVWLNLREQFDIGEQAAQRARDRLSEYRASSP